jgi:hypothetical protein
MNDTQFPYYTPAETIYTSNTLRPFSHIYQDSLSHLQTLLEGLAEGASVDVELSTQRRTTAADSERRISERRMREDAYWLARWSRLAAPNNGIVQRRQVRGSGSP